MANTAKKQPFHEQVAQRLIQQLKEGTAPWQKPWDPGQYSSLPYNPKTGNRYKGINTIHLMAQGYSDPRWMTYNQANEAEAQVKKGQKATSVQYWKFYEEQLKRDEDGKPVIDILTGKQVKERVKLERPRVFFANVFNAEQIDGLPPLEHKEYQWTPSERAENILHSSGAKIEHNAGDQACYRLSTDTIRLPLKSQFPTPDNYYACALHELGHWSGAEDRLNRDLKNPFGSQAYAKEELRAEIASMTIGAEVGVGHDPGQHAAYVNSWIKALQDDPLEIFRAAADAEKIHNYIMAFDHQQEQEQVVEAQENIGENMELNAYQTELARLLKLSTLTPGSYSPSATMKEGNHAAVFVDETPILLCGPVDDPESVQQVEALVANQQFQKALRAAGKIGELHGGNLSGSNFDWPDQIAAVTAKQSGEEVSTNDPGDGPIVALVLDDPHHALTTLCCVNTSMARIFDKTVPVLDDGHTLGALSLVDKIQDEQAEERRQNTTTQKIYIDVPFSEKEEAKSLGARWDRQKKSWYIPSGLNEQNFSKWLAESSSQKLSPSYEIIDPRYDARFCTSSLEEIIERAGQIGTTAFSSFDNAKNQWERIRKVDEVWLSPDGVQVYPSLDMQQSQETERQYLAVPFGERMAAKVAGALWDPAAKSWYVGPQGDTEKLARWNPDKIDHQQSPALSPQEEFADALRSVGCVVSGEHPIMDGNKHRISVEGEKYTENAGAGFYVGHLDGHPAGYIKNNRTGAEIRWKSKGYTLSDEQKAILQAEAASKLEQRNREQQANNEAAAQRVSDHVTRLKPVEAQTAYLKTKDIEPHPGIYTDDSKLTTYIPIYDVDGKQWSMQYVQQDGTKRLAKDSRKEGCFHVVGGQNALESVPVLIVAEGYATAASLSETVGHATVSAIDSGNLKAVAEALHAKYPEKPILIAGDDDRHLILTQGVNPGRSKAEEAAQAVGGKAIFPIFTRDEKNYPADLEPVTPQAYREHLRVTELLEKQPDLSEDARNKLHRSQLSKEQLNALQHMKKFTDFNDLAAKSELGKDGLRRQVLGAMEVNRPSQRKEFRQTVQQRHVPQKQAHRGARL